MTDDELRAWAAGIIHSDPGGLSHITIDVAPSVLRLLDESAALRKQVEGHCERIAAQSALLSKRAEVFDGSTGLSSPVAGRRSSGVGA